jgi:hypothetical protein
MNDILNVLKQYITVDDISKVIFEYTIVYSKCEKYNEKSIKLMNYLDKNKIIKISNDFNNIQIKKTKFHKYLSISCTSKNILDISKKSDIDVEFFLFILRNEYNLYEYMDYQPSPLYLGCCGDNKLTFLELPCLANENGNSICDIVNIFLQSNVFI